MCARVQVPGEDPFTRFGDAGAIAYSGMRDGFLAWHTRDCIQGIPNSHASRMESAWEEKKVVWDNIWSGNSEEAQDTASRRSAAEGLWIGPFATTDL